MSRPSASSALRFLTHDVTKKTSLRWALYWMYARRIEIVIRPKFLFRFSCQLRLRIRAVTWCLMRECNHKMNESHPSPLYIHVRAGSMGTVMPSPAFTHCAQRISQAANKRWRDSKRGRLNHSHASPCGESANLTGNSSTSAGAKAALKNRGSKCKSDHRVI